MPLHHFRSLPFFLVLMLLPAMGWSAPPLTARTNSNTIEFLTVPDRGLQPQAQFDAEGTLHLIYFQGTPANGDVFYVKRTSTAANWSVPLRVNSQPESAIATGTIRGAQLAVGSHGRVHVAWNGSAKALPQASGKYPAPMLYSRLNDAGDAFEPQRNLMQFGTALDGGGCVAADADGRVYVVWHAARNGAPAGEANRQIGIATSTDDGRTFSPEAAVEAAQVGVCGCCGLKAWVAQRGTVYVLYRSAEDVKNRDMHLLTSTDKGATFKDQLISPWTIVNCPMSSAAFGEGPPGVFAAWETDGQVSLAKLDANGAGPERINAPGTAAGRKHPSVAINKDGQILLTWTEGTGWQRGGSLAWQVFDAQGKATPIRGREPGIPAWSFAAAAARPDGQFVIVH